LGFFIWGHQKKKKKKVKAQDMQLAVAENGMMKKAQIFGDKEGESSELCVCVYGTFFFFQARAGKDNSAESADGE
jgi:hypothetical protein